MMFRCRGARCDGVSQGAKNTKLSASPKAIAGNRLFLLRLPLLSMLRPLFREPTSDALVDSTASHRAGQGGF